MAKVFIVRHGTTALNAEEPGVSTERIRGWSNVPLSQAGEQKAQQDASRFNHLDFSRVVSSDLERAHQTGKIIADAKGVPVMTDPNLRPWNLGDLTGKPVKDVSKLMDSYTSDPTKTVTGGESYADFYTRFAGALHGYLAGQDNVMLIAHSRNMLALPHLLSGGKKAIQPKGGPEPGEGYELNLDGKGKIQVKKL